MGSDLLPVAVVAVNRVIRSARWLGRGTCLLWITTAGPASPGIGFPWTDPEGKIQQFESRGAFETFLREAEVVSMKELGKGVTRPYKVLLEKDGIRLHAVFRTVDIYKRRWQGKQGLKMDFKDHYIFECAAYRLALLLGLENVPPVVPRRIDGKQGSLQAWVENGLNEDDRVTQKIEPPNARRWVYQIQQVLLFDNLIYNDDRNQGNILFDGDWNLWMIDHTRAFRTVPSLKEMKGLQLIERGVWERLQDLDEKVLEEKLGKPGFLTSRELKTLLKRRDLLVKHFRKLIEERGEAAVLVADLKLSSRERDDG